jgi:hypothetical protein
MKKKFTFEKKLEMKKLKVEAKADDIDLEIEDDTLLKIRKKEPLPKEVVEEIEKDTLDDYSEELKLDLSQMKKGWHDERRAKEAAEQRTRRSY